MKKSRTRDYVKQLQQAIHSQIQKLSNRTIFAIAILMVFFLGLFDYATGFELSFSFFYLVPISFTAWYISGEAGIFITFLSISIWMISNQLAGEAYSTEAVRYWNALIRILVFSGISRLISEFKDALHKERLLSQFDFLTGIKNRREFFSQAEVELARARIHNRAFSVAYIDLDHFKQVNDQKGHEEGDNLLKTITNNISNIIRRTDIFARIGGDEFVIFFPDTNQQIAALVIEKIEGFVRKKMADANSPVTMSIGVLTFLTAPQSVDAMLTFVDKLMYEAKAEGKNRTLYDLI